MRNMKAYKNQVVVPFHCHLTSQQRPVPSVAHSPLFTFQTPFLQVSVVLSLVLYLSCLCTCLTPSSGAVVVSVDVFPFSCSLELNCQNYPPIVFSVYWAILSFRLFGHDISLFFFFSLNFLKYMYQTSGRGIWQCLVFSWAFPVISAGKEYACNAGNPGSIPGLGRFPWRKDRLPTQVFLSFPGSSDGKESTCDARDLGLIPGMERFPWRRAWQPTPLFLPGKSPWIEKPGRLQSMGSQSQTWLSD